MATKKLQPPPVGAPTIDPVTAIARLRGQIDKAAALLAAADLSSDSFSRWELVTKNALEAAFGANHANVLAVENSGAVQMSYGYIGAPASHYEQGRRKAMTAMVSSLEGLIEVLEATGHPAAAQPMQVTGPSKSVFLVHGRDHRRHEVETVLRKLELDVVVLADQPSAGMTIIEKLEANSNCAFAVVLLTGDDVGGLNAPANPDLRPRARQNVILELGYFIGKLGRKNVCTLYQAGVELPSDYVGVGFVLLDEHEGWNQKLAKELKAAGFKIDMNLLD